MQKPWACGAGSADGLATVSEHRPVQEAGRTRLLRIKGELLWLQVHYRNHRKVEDSSGRRSMGARVRSPVMGVRAATSLARL